MKKVFILIIILYSQILSSQNIQVQSLNGEYIIPSDQIFNFEYIDYKMDLSDIQTKISEIRLTIDKQGKFNLMNTFDNLWIKANEMGSNAFSIEDVYFENDQYIVSVDLYYFDEDLMQENFSLYEENSIVIFGDLNTQNSDKGKTCKVNKEKVTIMPYQYVKILNEVNQKVKISVGGFMGSSVTIKGEPYKLGDYFSLGGLSVTPAGGAVSVSSGRYGSGVGMGIGINISTGSITPMNINFGLFAMTILDTVKNTEIDTTIEE